MGWILSKFEGLLLSLWGVGILWFALRGDYWMLLNPKFKWLTIFGAAVVFCFGLALLGWAKRSSSYGRIAIFVLLTLLTPGVMFKAVDSKPLLSSTASKVVKFFHTKKNTKYPSEPLTELFLSCHNKNKTAATSSFQTIGVVKRLPTLDREGEFALMETFVFCCLADAVAVGIRVPLALAPELKNGDWVRVFGTLEKLNVPKPTPPFRFGMVNMTVVSDTYIIRPDKIIQVDPPEIPFYFRVN